jgi:hypothetical protein
VGGEAEREEREERVEPRCDHLVYDELENEIGPDWWRSCVLCGVSYNRSQRVLDPFRERIRARHRLPPSPWTAAERAEDLEL